MRHMQLLRSRPVRVLWLSMALSVLGDRLYGLAAMWVVYESTGSSSLMGLVGVVESLPYIVLGAAGSLVARFTCWHSLARVDAGRALVAVAVPMLWSPDLPGFLVMLVLVLLLGSLSAVFEPNLGALIPQLVDPDQVEQVSCLFDLTSRVAAVVGQGSVGALLVLVPEIHLFAIDGFTFAVSAAALGWLGRRSAMASAGMTAMPVPEVPVPVVPVTEEGATGAGGAAGVGHAPVVRAWGLLRAHQGVGVAIAVHGVALFTAAVSTVGLPPLLVTRFGQGAAGYGLSLAATAAGGLGGNLLTGHLPPRRPWLATYCLAWTASGLALAGLGVAGSMTTVIALCVTSGLLFPVTAVTLRARLLAFGTAERLRLLTVDQTAIRTAGTAGLLLLPFAVDAAPATAFVGAGLLLSAAALLGWWLGGRTDGGTGAGTDGRGDRSPC
ncbi:MFS transporter [Streptomyces triculaminicus]|uniref:MFS transporter n=2 Tax=Streptomyces TaxID=1883 RepID=A0A939JPG3_9ACTN|nr:MULTISPECIES: MFS transporter [Streptomyces]MBO0652185.1 MFS transporter [Streptomyces triculaminicus]QSY46938.1 MFS transporter [Streptomyces griseocarneus]